MGWTPPAGASILAGHRRPLVPRKGRRPPRRTPTARYLPPRRRAGAGKRKQPHGSRFPTSRPVRLPAAPGGRRRRRRPPTVAARAAGAPVRGRPRRVLPRRPPVQPVVEATGDPRSRPRPPKGGGAVVSRRRENRGGRGGGVVV